MSTLVDSSVWFAAAAGGMLRMSAPSRSFGASTSTSRLTWCWLRHGSFSKPTSAAVWRKSFGSGCATRSSDRTHRPRGSGCGFGHRVEVPGPELFLD